MEGGDISGAGASRILVVLEGVLTTPLSTGRIKKKLAPASEWTWYVLPMKVIMDKITRENASIDVITFMGEDVRDAAAELLEEYKVEASEVVSVDFEMFCQSLLWRVNEVQAVVDSDWNRLQRYGQLGYGVSLGGGF